MVSNPSPTTSSTPSTSNTTGTTSTSTTTNVGSARNLKQVMFGTAFNLQQIQGLTPISYLNCSLNAKYSVFPTTMPTSRGALLYFGVGIGGRRVVSSTSLTEAQPIAETNMDLYQPIPIRIVPYDQDLTPTEQANYRMRTVMTVNGQKYIAYYLKLLVQNTTQPEFMTLNTSGTSQPFTPDPLNLTPTPPTPSTDGTVNTVGAEINVVTISTVSVTGQEISEAVNVLFNGDSRYAMLSELGLYTGSDQTMTYTNANGQSQTYTESLNTKLHTMATDIGYNVAMPSSEWTEQFYLGSGRVIFLS